MQQFDQVVPEQSGHDVRVVVIDDMHHSNVDGNDETCDEGDIEMEQIGASNQTIVGDSKVIKLKWLVSRAWKISNSHLKKHITISIVSRIGMLPKATLLVITWLSYLQISESHALVKTIIIHETCSYP